MDPLRKFIRSMVRPLVTVGLGVATVERLIEHDMEGAKYLGTFFGIAMTFYFSGRAAEKAAAAATDTAKAVAAATTPPTTPAGAA